MGNTKSKNKIVDEYEKEIKKTIEGMETFKKDPWKINISEAKKDYFELVKRICLLPYEIKKIEKINNNWLFFRYVGQKCFFSVRDNIETEEIIVFYGSNTEDPYKLCKDEIGLNFAAQTITNNNNWGRGLHFSNNVLYAHENSFSDEKNNNIRTIIVAKLLIGKHSQNVPLSETKPSETKPSETKLSETSKLRLPPVKENTINERYDLLIGTYKNTQKVFVYYENFNALPLYLITYDASKPVDVKFPNKWFWIDEKEDYVVLPPEVSTSLETNFREGNLKCELNFKLRFTDDSPQSFSITFIPDSKCANAVNKETNQTRELHCKNVNNSNIESLLCHSLEYDLQKTKKLFDSFSFKDNKIKILILTIIDELGKLVRQTGETNEVKKTNIDKDTEEFKEVARQFNQTMQNGEIIEVELIENRIQKAKYLMQKAFMIFKSNDVNEKHLFHGTRKTKPEIIFNDTVGFDMRYSQAGYWGEASYFAVNASYSHDYRYTVPENKNMFQMFLADVIIGKHTEKFTEVHKDTTLIKPPEIGTNSGKYYDSVYAETNGSDVYMVYENNRAYPKYLITYKKLLVQ